jgi:hypothetical protein
VRIVITKNLQISYCRVHQTIAIDLLAQKLVCVCVRARVCVQLSYSHVARRDLKVIVPNDGLSISFVKLEYVLISSCEISPKSTL